MPGFPVGGFYVVVCVCPTSENSIYTEYENLNEISLLSSDFNRNTLLFYFFEYKLKYFILITVLRWPAKELTYEK